LVDWGAFVVSALCGPLVFERPTRVTAGAPRRHHGLRLLAGDVGLATAVLPTSRHARNVPARPPAHVGDPVPKLRRSTAAAALVSGAMLASTLAVAPAHATPVLAPATFSDVGLAGPVPATLPTPGSTPPYTAAKSVGLPARALPPTVAALPAGDGAAVVSWVAPTNPAARSGVDAVWVQTYTAQGQYLGEQVAAPTASSVNVTGLVPAHDYLFGVLTESSGSFSGYRFSPQLRSTGFTGQPGLALPVPLPPAGVPGVPVQSLVDTATQALQDILRAVTGSAKNATIQADPVLGREAWQTYHDVDAGSGQRLSLNVANGNVVLSVVDSTPVQAHGQLSYTLRRTYNSQDTSTVATLPGSVGAGWRLNLGEEAGDTTGLGVLGTALQAPNGSSLQPGAVTLIDRDGTRHVFPPRQNTGGGISAAVPSLSYASKPPVYLGPGGVDYLARDPKFVLRALREPDLVCVDQSYVSPPGVHLGLWRYVRFPGSTAASCPANVDSAPGAVVLGYAAERPDRVRTEYAANGEIVSLVDRAGVEMRYVYDNPGSRWDACGTCTSPVRALTRGPAPPTPASSRPGAAVSASAFQRRWRAVGWGRWRG